MSRRAMTYYTVRAHSFVVILPSAPPLLVSPPSFPKLVARARLYRRFLRTYKFHRVHHGAQTFASLHSHTDVTCRRSASLAAATPPARQIYRGRYSYNPATLYLYNLDTPKKDAAARHSLRTDCHATNSISTCAKCTSFTEFATRPTVNVAG